MGLDVGDPRKIRGVEKLCAAGRSVLDQPVERPVNCGTDRTGDRQPPLCWHPSSLTSTVRCDAGNRSRQRWGSPGPARRGLCNRGIVIVVEITPDGPPTRRQSFRSGRRLRRSNPRPGCDGSSQATLVVDERYKMLLTAPQGDSSPLSTLVFSDWVRTCLTRCLRRGR